MLSTRSSSLRAAIRGGALTVAVALSTPSIALAQWPGEVSGRVVDRFSGETLSGVSVALAGTAVSAVTDGSGSFHLRGLEPGRHTLTLHRFGYASLTRTVDVRNGRTARLEIQLTPAPLDVEGVTAVVDRRALAEGGIVLDRAAIVGMGARSVGDVLRQVPGVIVQQRGRGAAETPSIRGSSADAVLVLVDGAPINDPITGDADLRSIPLGSVEQVTVYRGARSARFGPRAEGGVVLIESRSVGSGLDASLRGGSLGEVGTSVDFGTSSGSIGWAIGGEFRRIGGAFDMELPPEVGGGSGRRTNTDLEEVAGRAALDAGLADGRLVARVGYDQLERGLPGHSFAPADSARQELRRGRASLAWRRDHAEGSEEATAYGTVQRVRFHDPLPPLGAPFDDRTTYLQAGLSAGLERPLGWWLLQTVGASLSVDHQRVDADALEDDAPDSRTDAGGATHLTLAPAGGAWNVAVSFRVDYAGLQREWFASHEVALSTALGAVELFAAHRSSFSPPTLGDQFFREGVAVEPNPDLKAERIPSEFEVGAAASGELGELLWNGRLEAYLGDVKDMIVWLPDFRFVWSPRNVDVKRRGAEVWSELGLASIPVSLGGRFSIARITYDRADSDTVQVAYRPRYFGSAHAAWEPGPWRFWVEGIYTGTRYPVPAPVNALPPFWTYRLLVTRTWSLGRWDFESTLGIERLFDAEDTLIFGFPDPGRTISAELRLHTG